VVIKFILRTILFIVGSWIAFMALIFIGKKKSSAIFDAMFDFDIVISKGGEE
jgi:hypothetical protein